MTDRKHITIFAFITALCLVGDSMLYIVLPVYYEAAGLDNLWQVGVILSVNRIVRLPLNPFIGFVYRHISERTGIIIAVFLAIATTLSYGFLSSFVWWVLARCVWGLAWTLLRLGSLFCILKISTNANRGHFTGLYNGIYRLGSLVGMLAGGILADTLGIRLTALLFASFGLAAFILTLIYIPVGDREERNASKGSSLREGLALIVQTRQLVWLVLTGAAVGLAVQGVIASTLSRLIDAHTLGGVGLWGQLIGAASLAGFFQALRWAWEPWLAPKFGRVSDSRLGWRKMLIYTTVSAAIFFGSLAVPLPLPFWFACIFGLQLSATALTTVTEAAATHTASTSGGRALLMHYALVVDIGAALGPLIAYGMNAFWGINAVYLFCGLLFAVLAVIWRCQREAKDLASI